MISNGKSQAQSPTNPPAVTIGWAAEARATFLLAWPLVIAQLATIALTTTDVIMMGWLGPEFLAAGSLATSALFTFLILGIGLSMAVAPLVSQAIGAGEHRSIRQTVRQGLWISLIFSALVYPILSQGEWILTLLGQNPRIAALGENYLDTAVWAIPGALMFVVIRSLVSSHGQTGVILAVTVAAIAANALSNYVLMFGKFGFPRLELAGAGLSTAIVNTMMFAALLVYTVRHPAYRGYALLVRLWKPDWPKFFSILRLGAPIGLMLLAEVSLFTVAAVMMGWLGEDELAGHAIALQVAAVAFMVPLGLSQATTIRVGLAHGRGNAADVRTAGFVSIAMAAGFMCSTALLFWLAPEFLTYRFLDPAIAENTAPIALAASYLAIAALFQLADGVQVSTAAALRGTSDTTVPMVVAMVGYWVVGMPTAYYLGFIADMRGIGIWIGLASGLVFAAVVLLIRFALRSRLPA